MSPPRWRTPLSAFQLVAFQRKPKRPTLTSFDRLLWVGLSLLLDRLGAPLVYIQADTVVRWQRERFRRFRARRSRVNPRHRGRPATAVEIRRLIERMVADSSHYGLAGILSRRLANLLFDHRFHGPLGLVYLALMTITAVAAIFIRSLRPAHLIGQR